MGARDPAQSASVSMEKSTTENDTINLQAVDVFARVRLNAGVEYVTGNKTKIGELTRSSLAKIEQRIALLTALNVEWGVADQAGACCDSCCSKSMYHMFVCYCPCIMCGDCCNDLSTGKIADVFYVEDDRGTATEVLIKFQTVESFGEQEKTGLIVRALGSELASLRRQQAQITKLSN